ncbi:MAG: DNA primase [Clostridia bacterium]|nr:DNA primase [Clostridia bacterium]
MIPREVIEEIVRRSDIEQTIGSYVTLKRAGSNMVGLCPFHSEKSPSFTVFPGTDSFYCFGCGAGGDVITFIMKAENIDYVAALELLAKRCGVAIPQDNSSEYRKGPTRERIREMNVAAARFFHNYLLNAPDAAQARGYFASRKLTGATIKHFYLGYAPNDFGKLTNYLKTKGFTEEEMITGFLCGKSSKNGAAYDYFRNRVIFPIVDTSKNIVGFGGRVMDDSKPKYLNTSDTPAFKKSHNLFALNYAKDYCADELILCEGYMDVIALHQAGIQNAVATLGTAITEDHARIIAKYTKKVIVSYDSDEAGVNAANKAMRILAKVGVEVRILKMKGAKDPDEFIKKFGAAAFRNLVGESRTGFEFKLEAITAKYNLEDTSQKVRASAEIVGIIADYHSGVERELYIARAAEVTKIPQAALREDVERIRKARIREQQKEVTREAHASIRSLGDKVNPDAAQNSRVAFAEETVLGLMLIFPEYRDRIASEDIRLEENDFLTSLGKRAFSAIMRLHGSEGGFAFALLGEEFTPDEIGRIRSWEIKRRALSENGTGVFAGAINVLHEERMKREKPADSISLADALAQKRRELEEARKKRFEEN